jgi:mannosyltransferase
VRVLGVTGIGRPLLAVTALAAALRFGTLDVQSFDGDELLEAWMAGLPLRGLLTALRETDKLPYLPHLAAWAWAGVAGEGETAMRLPSAIAGTLTVPAVGAAGSLLASRRAGVVAAMLVAVNPLMVWYSQQARAYALVALLGVLSLLCFARVLRSGTALPLVLWALTSALAVATQYFAAFLVAAEGLWLLRAAAGGEVSLRPVRVAAAAAVPVIVLAAHVPLALAQLDAGAPGQVEDVGLLTRIAQVPKVFLVGYSAPAELAMTVVAAGLVAVALTAAGRISGQERDGAIVAAAMAAGAIGIPVLLAVAGVDYLAARYLITGLATTAIVLGCCAGAGGRATLAVAGLAVLSLVVVIAVAATPTLQRTNWRGAARAAGPADGPRGLVTPAVLPGAVRVYFAGARMPPAQGEAVGEVVVVGLATQGQFTAGAPRPPRPPSPRPPAGFRLTERREAATFTLLRYRAARPRTLAAADLARLALDPADLAAWVQP